MTQEPSDVEATVAALLTASRALLGIAVRSVAAAPVPLTVPQHRLLVLVSSEGPRRMGAVAEDLGVNQSNASRLVDRLATLGLVRRTQDADDRRASLVELTGEGWRALAAVTEVRRAALRTIVQDMAPERRGGAAAALREFSRAARQGEPPGPDVPPRP